MAPVSALQNHSLAVAAPKARAKDAVSQFESLLLEQMLRSIRQDDGKGWLGGGDDQASESIVELAEQQVAQALARAGGLGLSKSGLERLLATKDQ